jgi:salicylate hydroxylase
LPAGTVTGLWWGGGAHLVHYPVDAGRSINVVVIGAFGADEGGPPRIPFGGELRDLVDAVPEWTHWPLLQMDIAPPWANGRAVLIGDAAHAMPPSAAQGGGMAIEDAWVLGRSLAAHANNPTAALAHYEQVRRPRVIRVAHEARRNLWVYNLGQPLAAARNLLVSTMPARMHLARMDWLFGYPRTEIR